ncbi:lysylphosphatidylglycerol synthase transmembrane domain-containing protein [Streptomyces sp. 8N706]|uniref:lysylphosphatidylglycerol synthase transmembrane domain-containing protein n=1 Tax=Streptomyces sp. 8N706 TaxID=3457416 RepID=UPI003FD31D76
MRGGRVAGGGAPQRPARPAPTRVRGLVITRAGWARIRTLAGLGILIVLLWRLGTGAFLDGLRRIDSPALLGAVAIGLLTTVCSAWRWCLVARGLGLRLPLGQAVADYYRALFLNAALPGGVLGDVHRAVRHGQHAGDLGRGVRAVVLERAAGQVALLAAGVTILLARPSLLLAGAHHLAATPGAAAALAVVGGLVVAAVVRLRRRPGTSRGWRAVRAALAEARLGLLARGSWPGVVISSAVVLAGHLGTFLLAARVAGSVAPAAELVPLMVLALIAMALPLNVGGWGPREGVTAWAFAAAGLGAAQGLTVAVVYGALTFAASLPGIGVILGRWVAGLRPERPQFEFEERVLAESGAAHRGA